MKQYNLRALFCIENICYTKAISKAYKKCLTFCWLMSLLWWYSLCTMRFVHVKKMFLEFISHSVWKWIPVTSEQHLKLLYYDTQRQINSSIRQSWIKITYKHNQNNTSFTPSVIYRNTSKTFCDKWPLKNMTPTGNCEGLFTPRTINKY